MKANKARCTLAILMAILAALPILLTFMLGSVFALTAFEPFYQHEYEKNNTLAVIGTDQGTLDAMTDAVIGYLCGTRENLDLAGNIRGRMTEIFSIQAKIHMQDVLFLYDLGRLALLVCLPVIALLILGSIFTAPKRRRIHCLSIGLLSGMGAVILCFAVVVFFAAQDFLAAFTVFHELLFTNDLWLFDASDVLIQMLPTQFFIDIAVLIAICFGALTLIMVVLCMIGVSITGARLRKWARQNRPDAQQIFESMQICDDSAVPEQTRSLIEVEPDKTAQEAAPDDMQEDSLCEQMDHQADENFAAAVSEDRCDETDSDADASDCDEAISGADTSDCKEKSDIPTAGQLRSRLLKL